MQGTEAFRATPSIKEHRKGVHLAFGRHGKGWFLLSDGESGGWVRGARPSHGLVRGEWASQHMQLSKQGVH